MRVCLIIAGGLMDSPGILSIKLNDYMKNEPMKLLFKKWNNLIDEYVNQNVIESKDSLLVI